MLLQESPIGFDSLGQGFEFPQFRVLVKAKRRAAININRMPVTAELVAGADFRAAFGQGTACIDVSVALEFFDQIIRKSEGADGVFRRFGLSLVCFGPAAGEQSIAWPEPSLPVRLTTHHTAKRDAYHACDDTNFIRDLARQRPPRCGGHLAVMSSHRGAARKPHPQSGGRSAHGRASLPPRQRCLPR